MMSVLFPPSSPMICPVINPPSSPSSIAPNPTTSSACPILRIGCVAANPSLSASDWKNRDAILDCVRVRARALTRMKGAHSAARERVRPSSAALAVEMTEWLE